jgi:hypothetical protein
MANRPPRERRSQSLAQPTHGTGPVAAWPVASVGLRGRRQRAVTSSPRTRPARLPADRPATGRRGSPRPRPERVQRSGPRRLLADRELGQDAGQQGPPAGGRLLHHLPARRGDRNLHGPAIGAGPMPARQAVAGSADDTFLQAKLVTARFYCEQVLPQSSGFSPQSPPAAAICSPPTLNNSDRLFGPSGYQPCGDPSRRRRRRP